MRDNLYLLDSLIVLTSILQIKHQIGTAVLKEPCI